jgi:hypothetical protein
VAVVHKLQKVLRADRCGPRALDIRINTMPAAPNTTNARVTARTAPVPFCGLTEQEFDAAVQSLRGRLPPKSLPSTTRKRDSTPELWAAHRDYHWHYNSTPDQKKKNAASRKKYADRNPEKVAKSRNTYARRNKATSRAKAKDRYYSDINETRRYKREHARKSRVADPERARSHAKRWQAKNPDKVRNNSRKQYLKRKARPDRVRRDRDRQADWVKENKEHLREYKRTYAKRKHSSDENVRLANCLRARLRLALRGKVCDVSAVRHCGKTVDELRAHIESLWTVGMSWANFGRWPGQWNVDHFFPLRATGIDLTDDSQALAINNWRNLRPMWKEANDGKRNRVCHEARTLFDTLVSVFRNLADSDVPLSKRALAMEGMTTQRLPQAPRAIAK